MSWRDLDLCCPRCRGDLRETGAGAEPELACTACEARYPVVLDIPDLRVFPDPYIDVEADHAKGRKLAAQFDRHDFAGLVRWYYEQTPVVTAAQAATFTAGLLAAPARAEATLEAWEGPAPAQPRQARLLEVGCGTAPMLLAARARYAKVVGVDIAFRWLVVGRRRLLEAGAAGAVPLVCACAEALPFREGTVDTIAADAVIENVREADTMLAEAHRVLRAGGRLHLTTSNRFSLGPDPQTGIWAVGWRPARQVEAAVRRAGGIPPKRTLLSAARLRRLLGAAGFASPRLALPSFPPAQRAQFPPLVRRLVGAYEVAARLPLSRHALFLVGPKLLAGAEKGAR